MLANAKKNIVIVDIDYAAIALALKRGFAALHISQVDMIKLLLGHAYCVITATGQSNCISTYFNKKDFDNVILKINMGTYDEWGKKFRNTDIINNKKPANFMLNYPTKVMYLDPVFAALIEAAVLDCPDLKPGLTTLPKAKVNAILKDFYANHPDLEEKEVSF